MKNWETIKDEVAIEHDYSGWHAVVMSHDTAKPFISVLAGIAARRYAEQAIREAAEICKEHRDSGCFDGEGAEANILNLINELQ